MSDKSGLLTFVLIECAADSCQQRQGDQIPQTGSDGSGHVVRVDPHLPGADDHSNHHQTCGRDRPRPTNRKSRVQIVTAFDWYLYPKGKENQQQLCNLGKAMRHIMLTKAFSSQQKTNGTEMMIF